ncbi:hypothetical protein MKK55_17975 [Methylobacterium sp. J-059]|uniref:hypothetical protein n=1 Tax=Methylobacterium sp. J-059 TaxID=2836643 RepID=UPI001FBAD281|nr:hypothetical protein [Methylobacterium sp. J-059]MCJ2040821.1 hypothetical protein [Methylobacterium sp. J-059]
MRGENFAETFERGAYSLAAGLAIAHQNGLALGEARVAAARAAHEDAVTVEHLATVGQAMARDRRELAALRAENAALKAELAKVRRAEAVRVAVTAARRTNARRA